MFYVILMYYINFKFEVIINIFLNGNKITYIFIF